MHRRTLRDLKFLYGGNLTMTRLIFSTLVLVGTAVAGAAEFSSPVRLQGGDQAVRVESPGYAAPCWVDIDGDGKKDLLVGQFNRGKIKVYKNLGKNILAAGKWLEADGKVAEVPGVW